MPSLPFRIPRIRSFGSWELASGVKIIGFVEIFLNWIFLVLHGSTALFLASGVKSVDGMGRADIYKTQRQRDLGAAAWSLVFISDLTAIVIAIGLLFGVFYEILCLVVTWVRIKCFLIFSPLISVIILVFFEDYLVIIISYALTTALYCFFVVVVNSYAYNLELGNLNQLNEDESQRKQ